MAVKMAVSYSDLPGVIQNEKEQTHRESSEETTQSKRKHRQ